MNLRRRVAQIVSSRVIVADREWQALLLAAARLLEGKYLRSEDRAHARQLILDGLWLEQKERDLERRVDALRVAAGR